MITDAPFEPRVDVLPVPQQRVWAELTQVPGMFVLYGGTALALHLGHRQSVDFDFFGGDNFDPGELAAGLPLLADAQITRQSPNTLTVLVDRGGPVKLSFFGLPRLARLLPPHVAQDNGLQVASMLDLAGTKAAVVQRRAEAKDYIDLDAILTSRRVTLANALAAASAIYGEAFNPLLTLKALTSFDDGDLSRLPDAVQRRLIAAAAAVDPAALP